CRTLDVGLFGIYVFADIWQGAKKHVLSAIDGDGHGYTVSGTESVYARIDRSKRIFDRTEFHVCILCEDEYQVVDNRIHYIGRDDTLSLALSEISKRHCLGKGSCDQSGLGL